MTSAECLPWALGVGGMTFDTFCALTPGEFQQAVEAITDDRRQQERSMWERLRTLACVAVSPFCKQPLQPHKLLPLPWDKEPAGQPQVSKQEGRQAFLRLMATRH